MCSVEYGKASRAPGPVERAVSLISCKRSWARAGTQLGNVLALQWAKKHCDLSGKIYSKPGIPNDLFFTIAFFLKRHKRDIQPPLPSFAENRKVGNNSLFCIVCQTPVVPIPSSSAND